MYNKIIDKYYPEDNEQKRMLHDIGILYTHAPSIHCNGTEHYIRHGMIGAQMLCDEGLPRHALVCSARWSRRPAVWRSSGQRV